MTSVMFKRNSGKLVNVNIKDHAGFAEEGEDIVCSAISAISLTIANGITDVLNIKANCSVQDGYLLVNLEDLTAEEIDECQTLMETMLLGLKNLEISYGDYIKVEVEEV